VQGLPQTTPDIATGAGASVLIDGEPVTVYDTLTGQSKTADSRAAADMSLLTGGNKWFTDIQEVRIICFRSSKYQQLVLLCFFSPHK
jgi:hypothetical protein